MTYPNKKLIEPRFKESIDRFVESGCPMGGFLTAVLNNDLTDAIGLADPDALENIPHIIAYLYNDIPSEAWGSPSEVSAWAKKFHNQTTKAK